MGRAGYAASVAFGTLVVLLTPGLAFRDDPPPQDADLIPAVVPVSDADDAYPLILKLNAAFPPSQGVSARERSILVNNFREKASDEPVVKGLIARNTKALALFGEISHRSAFRDPNYRDLGSIGMDTPIPQFLAVVSVARLSSLQAESLLKKGRGAEALAEALRIVDVGRSFTRFHQQLIEQIVGMLVMDIGTERALEIVTSGKLDRASLRGAAARLSAGSDTARGLQEALRYEYVREVHAFDHRSEIADLYRGLFSVPERGLTPKNLLVAAAAKGAWYIFLPHRTKALVAARFRRIIADAGGPCPRTQPARELLPLGPGPNIVGRILYNAIPAGEKIAVRRCETDFRASAAATAAALQAYRLDHGRFPASSAELTPGYLSAAPVDPFAGSRYARSADGRSFELCSGGASGEQKYSHADGLCVDSRAPVDVRKADVYGAGRDGWANLMNAAVNDRADALRLLIDDGADINGKDADGLTALMLVAVIGSEDTARILIDNGADVNAKAKDGRTALANASSRRRADMVRLLIARGADIDAVTGAPAQFELGRMYQLGQGVPKDLMRAFALFRKAAKQGYAPGKYQLARMCLLFPGWIVFYSAIVLMLLRSRERKRATAL
jgi:hypothetical protein